jgi:iron complex transport system substrate-binding protein
MMRFRPFPALVPLFLGFSLLSAGCTPASRPVSPTAVATAVASATPAAVANFPVTVKDDSDRTVTFDRPPQRIASLTPGHTETLYALGAGDRVLVTDKYSDFPAENRPKATLDTYPKPNAEELVSLKPDLIVVLVEGDEFIQQVETRGIKVLKLFPKTFDGALGDIELLGRATGTEARARQITSDMRERAATVVAKTKNAPKPRVLYELDASEPARPFVAGPAGFFGGLVPMAGGQNVFDDIGKPSGQVSTEQIVARNPEIIIMGDADSPFNAQTPEMVKARPGWQVIAAVRTGRIHPLDQAFLSRPGPRLAAGLERMAKIIHPELFP